MQELHCCTAAIADELVLYAISTVYYHQVSGGIDVCK
jgi:hypothetical protein